MSTITDAEISRRLQGLAAKVSKIVENHLGGSHLMILVIQPWGDESKPDEKREFQYISNAPREFVHGAFKALVEKWEGDGSVGWTPPHERQ